MLKWVEKINLGKGRYIARDAEITDTQHLLLVKNDVHGTIYVEYIEQDAQTKRFYLESHTLEEAEQEAVSVVYNFLQGEAHAWLKRLNRLKDAAFKEEKVC